MLYDGQMVTNGMRPMSEFGTTKPLMVHDSQNDLRVEAGWAANCRERAIEDEDGVIEWDALLLDGWGYPVRH